MVYKFKTKGGHGGDGAIEIITEQINDSTTVEKEIRGPGQNGQPGGDGGHGGYGGDGGDGGNVHVFFTANAEYWISIIEIESIGGYGGDFGRAGDGGRGGYGGNGNPDGNDGADGRDGCQGEDGRRGYDGQVIYHPFFVHK